jgi:hypothetical protein
VYRIKKLKKRPRSKGAVEPEREKEIAEQVNNELERTEKKSIVP